MGIFFIKTTFITVFMKMQNLLLTSHMYSKMLCLNNWDVFHKPAEKDCSPGRKGGPVMMRNTWPLSLENPQL